MPHLLVTFEWPALLSVLAKCSFFSEQVISDEWPVEGEDISLSPRHQALAL